MTAKRLAILVLVLGIGLSGIYALPHVSKQQPVGINLKLPSSIGVWEGRDSEISEREIAILGRDTEFARKLYTNPFGDAIFVSIVLSGQDMNTSIHRPERCLPAQGWTIVNSRKQTIPMQGQQGGGLTVTQLHNVTMRQTRDGQSVKVYSLNDYWFVGLDTTTADHNERTLFDIRDRLLRGYNQRWAYVTVVSNITKGFQPFGRNETETDKMLRQFIEELSPLVTAQTVKYR
ncbi:MAG TPA: EpsI family protein [Chthoniobacterales bacterium]